MFSIARENQQLQWDRDFNPEGISISYNNDLSQDWNLRLQAINYQLDTQTSDATYPTLYGVQAIGIYEKGFHRYSLNAEFLHYVDLISRAVFSTSPGTNSQSGNAYLYNYTVSGAGLYYKYTGWRHPVQVYIDYAKNNQVNKNNLATGGGVIYGSTEKNYDWQVSAVYQELGKDAVLDMFTHGAFMGGGTDNRGTSFRVDQRASKSSVISLIYYDGQRFIASNDSSPTTAFKMLQLDWMVSY
ncbi:MAG: putative porin [Bdellovibrionales bacterium]